MINYCSIVMYHYVRELQYTRYPNIKALRTTSFKEQIAYLRKNYNFVTAHDIIAAIHGKRTLPEKPVWLTFDDAYIDHYVNVFPILDMFGIEGAFFPPAKAIRNHEVLDVNKIHFILASGTNMEYLIKEIYSMLDELRRQGVMLEKNEYYWNKLAKASRFDSAEVIFVKRLLQVELPEEIRRDITGKLFCTHVTENEEMFSRELYMSEEQLKCMLRHGMFIGGHGYDHYWLNSLPRDQQELEIDKSLAFLDDIGVDTENWVMNYPYGGHNESLIEIIKRKGCKFALTTKAAVAELTPCNAFTLQRLDTNDFPTDRNA